jgi:hypothetical protein
LQPVFCGPVQSFGFLEIKRLVAVQLPPNLAKDWTRLDFQTLLMGEMKKMWNEVPGGESLYFDPTIFDLCYWYFILNFAN